MSDTPETDAAQRHLPLALTVVEASFARRLERERDFWRRLYEEADWRTLEAQTFRRERDDARRLLQAMRRVA